MRQDKSEQLRKLEVDDTWETFYKTLKDNGKLISTKRDKSDDA